MLEYFQLLVHQLYRVERRVLLHFTWQACYCKATPVYVLMLVQVPLSPCTACFTCGDHQRVISCRRVANRPGRFCCCIVRDFLSGLGVGERERSRFQRRNPIVICENMFHSREKPPVPVRRERPRYTGRAFLFSFTTF